MHTAIITQRFQLSSLKSQLAQNTVNSYSLNCIGFSWLSAFQWYYSHPCITLPSPLILAFSFTTQTQLIYSHRKFIFQFLRLRIFLKYSSCIELSSLPRLQRDHSRLGGHSPPTLTLADQNSIDSAIAQQTSFWPQNMKCFACIGCPSLSRF